MRSSHRIERVRVAIFAALGTALLLGCSSSRSEPIEALATGQAALLPLEPPTSVVPGAPSTLTRSCPGEQFPDLCGSWAGVELSVSREFPRAQQSQQNDESADEHCRCAPIEFEIPKELPVSRGNSGWDWDELKLSFRQPSGKVVECRYRGNGSPPGLRPGTPPDGDKYVLEKCSDRFKGGQTTTSDWFALELKHGHPLGDAVEVQVRLGEPDVVDGELREQIFYARDPRIAGAALHVPRGTAPAFESFSLDPLPQVPPGTLIENSGNPLTAVSYAVDVRSDTSDPFVFTPVAGAACPRVELPYDPDIVAGLLGPQAIVAKHLTTLTGLDSGADVLAPMGPVTVNLAAHTLSFCVQHLTYYLGGTAALNDRLAGASIRSIEPGILEPLPATNLLASLPVIHPGERYELTLSFTNIGTATWLSPGTVKLVPVTLSGGIATVVPSLWGSVATNDAFVRFGFLPPDDKDVPGPDNSGPSTVYATAVFTFNVTAPSTPGPLNFCLKSNTATSPFGDCFTWNLPGAGQPGGNVPLVTTRACYDGAAATRNVGACHDGTSTFNGTSWSACADQRLPGNETCGGDNDCDGSVDESGCVDDATFVPPGQIPSQYASYVSDAGRCDWEGDVLMLFCDTCDSEVHQVTFSMRNTGTTTWKVSKGYHFSPVMHSNCQLVNGSTALAADVRPGQSANFNLGFRCPACDEGTFGGMMANDERTGTKDNWFGDRAVTVACAQSCQ